MEALSGCRKSVPGRRNSRSKGTETGSMARLGNGEKGPVAGGGGLVNSQTPEKSEDSGFRGPHWLQGRMQVLA